MKVTATTQKRRKSPFYCNKCHLIVGIVFVMICFIALVRTYQEKKRLIVAVFALAEGMVLMIYFLLGPVKESMDRESRNSKDYSKFVPHTDTEMEAQKQPLKDDDDEDFFIVNGGESSSNNNNNNNNNNSTKKQVTFDNIITLNYSPV